MAFVYGVHEKLKIVKNVQKKENDFFVKFFLLV